MPLTLHDSLIASDLANLAQILSTSLFLSVVCLLGVLCRNVEKALFFTLTTSAAIFFLSMIT